MRHDHKAMVLTPVHAPGRFHRGLQLGGVFPVFFRQAGLGMHKRQGRWQKPLIRVS